MYCNEIYDESQLYQIFHADFPNTEFRILNLLTHSIFSLSDDVFGEVTFEEARVFNGILSSVGPKTFIKSATTLKKLNLYNNSLVDFPYETLNQYTSLEYFSLHTNPIASFPMISSKSLKILHLGNAAYNTIPVGALEGLPNLEYFSQEHTHLDSIATELFTSLSYIKDIDMANTGLVHLENNLFELIDNEFINIHLQHNNISSIDTDAFKGVQSGYIDLANNAITTLAEHTWTPLFDAGVYLFLTGNYLDCGCDVAWLVLEPTYHQFLQDARCHTWDGDELVDLDPAWFENNCIRTGATLCL